MTGAKPAHAHSPSRATRGADAEGEVCVCDAEAWLMLTGLAKTLDAEVIGHPVSSPTQWKCLAHQASEHTNHVNILALWKIF